MERKALLNDKSYYAVIFTSIQSEVNKDYEEMAELMISLAKNSLDSSGQTQLEVLVSG